jgi:hypothetical protein
MKSYLHLIWHNPFMTKYASECTGGQILNFQNTFDMACDEIRIGDADRKFLWKPNVNEISIIGYL